MNLVNEQISWADKVYRLKHMLVFRGTPVPAMTWQSVDISMRSEMEPLELLNIVFTHRVAAGLRLLQEEIQPNLPWAEDHFLERVSGEPLNPPPSHEWWPFNQKGNQAFRSGGQFSHTYPERFWPKRAGVMGIGAHVYRHKGIRFHYGDLSDVVELLNRDPMTRQAFLPVWFPEDTGVVHEQRVPCTLGYHFIRRADLLHTTYFIRSCDFVRHFADDVYMAMRLNQWMVEQIDDPTLRPGLLTMHIVSLHCFAGDVERMKGELRAQTHAG